MSETKEKLLDTAERLFSEQGYDATSLRQIIAEAGVNLAAIHYHFGSKQELLDELIMRKAEPVNEERLKLLEMVENEAAGRPPAVEKVLDAFLAPMARSAHKSPQFVRLMGRIYAEGHLLPAVQRNFQPVIARFLGALRKALPHLPEEEFQWRVHFMIGAMAHTMCGSPDYTQIAQAPSGFPWRIEFLIRFLSGGFHAPAPESAKVEVTQ